MTLRHLLSVMLTAACLDVDIRCEPQAPSPEPRQPRVTAIATSVRSLHASALETPSLGAGSLDDTGQALVAIRLWQLRSRLDEIDRLTRTPLVCLGAAGLLWQDLGPLRSSLGVLQERLDQQENAVENALPEAALRESEDLFEDELRIHAGEMLHESALLMDEAGGHGCPL